VRPALLFGALALVAQTAPSDRGVNFYSLAKEIQIGQSNSDLMAKSVKIFHDSRVDPYLSALGAELAGIAGGAPLTYSFAVFRGDAPSLQLIFPWDSVGKELTEAIASGGGPIFVPARLIEKLDNEPELAAVLAHAIAHIVLRHPSRTATRFEIATLAAQGLGQYSRVQEVARLGSLKLARGFEVDADTLAVSILVKAGFDPSGLVRYLLKLAADRVQNVESQILLLPDRTYRADSGRFSEWKRAVTAQ
jgi:predicted Zn-dependent protease